MTLSGRSFNLTPLTRSANQRRSIVLGFDIRTRLVAIFAGSLVVGVPLCAIVWVFIGGYAIVVPIIVTLVTFYLVEHRSREGLRLRAWEQLRDKHKTKVGEFTCCGVPIDPFLNEVGVIVVNTVPVATRSDDPLADAICESATALDLEAAQTAVTPICGRPVRRVKAAPSPTAREPGRADAPLDMADLIG